MVRTRSLGRALDQAIGKALGKREASDDDNDAPKRWTPTASTCRQRQEARVVEDPPTVVEELNEEQQQPLVEKAVTDVEGFSRRIPWHINFERFWKSRCFESLEWRGV